MVLFWSMKTLLLVSLSLFVVFPKAASAAITVELVSTATAYLTPAEDFGIYDFRFKVTAVESDVYISKDALDVRFYNSSTGIRALPLSSSISTIALKDAVAEGNLFLVSEGTTGEFRTRSFFQSWEPGFTVIEARLDSLLWGTTVNSINQTQYLSGFETNGLILQGVPESSTALLGIFGFLGLMRRRR